LKSIVAEYDNESDVEYLQRRVRHLNRRVHANEDRIQEKKRPVDLKGYNKNDETAKYSLEEV